LGPLVLGASKVIAVPAAINTYLRDYQREGVKFFWRQYSEGRGGLLGDDMGLVRRFLETHEKRRLRSGDRVSTMLRFILGLGVLTRNR